ncbi:hypothetical protein [Priestia taiwanensis]|uniref:Zinc-finger domain-containing protein n=1 Tax=Priestia taiwanensis TaxID=1347902 RepID=A0A917EL43_9BACI|nr:hypothetical protein [Priestia taiwanensis]MBM7361855.1 PHP family Zn ribbon phosphoesterase [Priestia taiwanensis]GGE57456.1 hypothetical protein GCM10007140_04810 [Priestia taiwanensis]
MKHVTDEQLISYQLNELSLEDTTFVMKHISTCMKCQEKFELLNMLTDEWDEPSITHISTSLEDSIMSMIETSKQVKKPTYKPNAYMKYIHFGLAAAVTLLFFKADVTGRLLNTSKQMTDTYGYTVEQTNKFSIELPKWMTPFTHKEE